MTCKLAVAVPGSTLGEYNEKEWVGPGTATATITFKVDAQGKLKLKKNSQTKSLESSFVNINFNCQMTKVILSFI